MGLYESKPAVNNEESDIALLRRMIMKEKRVELRWWVERERECCCESDQIGLPI